MRSYQHRDFFLPGAPENLGFPTLDIVDAHSVVVGDWNGRLRRIEIDSISETASTHLDRGLMSYLVHQVRIDPADGRRCAVSTRTAGCFVGAVGDAEFQQQCADGQGPVNCVAYSPDGTVLAIGRGYYALHDGRVNGAYVEIWQVRDGVPAWCEQPVLVPWICVDLIAWPSAGPGFICVTGLRNQSGGFLIPFDATYNAQRYFEITTHFARGLVYDYSQAIVLDSHALVAYSVRTGEVKWSMQLSNALGVAHDSPRNEVVLTTGAVVSTTDGSTVCNLDPLEECSSVAFLPGGRVIGVSRSGVIRIWEESNE